MNKPRIEKAEFRQRLDNMRVKMKELKVDAILIYGDEFRRENLRYASNYWPIFDRGAFVAALEGEPMVLTAPESKAVAEELCCWEDLRNVPDMCSSYVDDTIDYPYADYFSLADIANELRQKGKLERLGVVGVDAMCHDLYCAIEKAFACELVNMDKVLYRMREIKSVAELACMREAGRIAQAGIEAVMHADLIGMPETEAAGIAEAAARKAGAEAIVFTLCSSGKRTNHVVPRASTDKIIEDGDMVALGIATMYQGYTATCQIPFAVGNYSAESWTILDALIRAWELALPELRPNNPMKNIVVAVRDQFRREGLSKFDLYPPLHGAGLAEAENPYPDENTERAFAAGMCFNTDISLFGAPGDSNRIEAGYIITEDGNEAITPIVDAYCEKWLRERAASPFCKDRS
ncbi:MAG: M24 family metallopeptidase [Candidatus Pelethousia sp.]|nr:M24 family metallopeptidase [Candidatus Pelethousia sp.]